MTQLLGICGSVAGLAAVLGAPAMAQASLDSVRLLDGFESTAQWSAAPADGVRLQIGTDPGRTDRSMRLDFDFQGHGGYAIARRALNLNLPENYEFSFWIRGNARPNTLEFKLADSTGENVWWYTRPRWTFPRVWQRVTIRRRQIRFAWGPAGGGELRRAATLELVVTAADGGAGSVWIDDLEFRRRDPDRPYDLTPVATASSGGATAAAVLDGSAATAWRAEGSGPQWLALDFLRPREFGGIVLAWAPRHYASNYAVETSSDGKTWTVAYRLEGGNGGKDYLSMPETECRFLRVSIEHAATPDALALLELTIQPLDWGDSSTTFAKAVARDAPPGNYPRYFSDQQVFWTILGVSGDGRRGLISEDGALEPGQGGFSIEPFLLAGRQLLSWHDVHRSQRLARGELPIPSVDWTSDHRLDLTITAFAAGTPRASSILARYRITNRGTRPVSTTLFLALRPFQVNPPWQFLGTPGGVAPLHRLDYAGGAVVADSQPVVAVTPASGFGATILDRGDVVEFLRNGEVPPSRQSSDSLGRASGALSYKMKLTGGGRRDVWLEIPLYGDGAAIPRAQTAAAADRYGEGRLAATSSEWSRLLDRVAIRLPTAAADFVATIKANLAFILINRDSAGIEPGARSYRRSWIRDGAMISTALLRLGQPGPVKDFLQWYAPYQYPDGKVPCCVDSRGADPVPENDSHGELIYLAMEYYRHTGDRATLERLWPRVSSAVHYIDSLRQTRLTAVYQTPESLAFRGLLPQSISHEGYSAKPMHSYWDDFYTLRGLKDAADIAGVLGHRDEQHRFGLLRDQFRHDLYASIQRAMATKGIDFIPGSVELGDFDPTSTTIAVAPVGELGYLPDSALRRTFERYWDGFRAREGGKPWDSYTPYELRTVGTLLRLGWKDRARHALDWFFSHRRPLAWRQWAEVVWHDPQTPKFIGDLPHTWVGSDFLRSALDFFVYEREADSALVIGQGISEKWVTAAPGVSVAGLSTHFGPIAYSMRGTTKAVHVRIAGGPRMPAGGIVVRSPLRRPIRRAVLNGKTITVTDRSEVIVRSVPADLKLEY